MSWMTSIRFSYANCVISSKYSDGEYIWREELIMGKLLGKDKYRSIKVDGDMKN